MSRHGRAFGAMLQRDLKLALQRRADVFLPLAFFVLVVSLFPIAISPAPATLEKIAPGVIWIACLLAVLLSLQGLLRTDFEDGSMQQLLLSPCPGPLLAGARIIAQWCIIGLPLVMMGTALGVLLYLDAHTIGVLFLSLLLGVPYLNTVGMIGVALTLGIRQAGALLVVLTLPLYVPALIFGSHAISAAAAQQPYQGQLLWLAALLTLALTLSPFIIDYALRVVVGQR